MINLENIKVGDAIYDAYIDEDGCQINTYICSSIQKDKVLFIRKTKWTWINKAAIGKTFSKTQDWGWATNIDENDRRRFTASGLSKDKKADYFHTEKEALSAALKEAKKGAASLARNITRAEKKLGITTKKKGVKCRKPS